MDAPFKPASKVDSARERELFRYYHPSRSQTEGNVQGRRSLTILPGDARPVDGANPPDNTLAVDRAISPDNTLTALAQLCAIRLNAQRAMISVIDKDHQYFLAESTKTLNLQDSEKYEMEGDGLWVGCSKVRKEGRLCEATIELKPVSGGFPCFMVTDLSKDSRFNQLPFVAGPPFFKFYAGTPLTTTNGINIGSLFIIDNVVRPPLNVDQQAFIGSVAQIIMTHMEVFREAEERMKVMRMSRGLNAFVEGKSSLHAEDYPPRGSISHYESVINGQVETGDFLTPFVTQCRRATLGSEKTEHNCLDTCAFPAAPGNSANLSASASASPHRPHRPEPSESPIRNQGTSQSESDAEDSYEKEDIGHQKTIKRAANLLRQSLDLHDGGGVVFFDTAMNFDRGMLDTTTMSDGPVNEYLEAENKPASFSSRRHLRRHSSISFPGIFKRNGFGGDSEALTSQKPAGIIGFSTHNAAMGLKCGVEEPDSFTPLGEDSLQYFLNRYPRGKLWSFDEDGSLSSSEEELKPNEKTPLGKRESRNQRSQLIASMLQKHFPGARQLLFAPLWDSGALRWFSGCFVFNTSSVQIFSRETELNFVTAFNNSMMAEVSRLTSIAADRQKADFIGSISHELRSPLHGILASADFLAETEPDAFQGSLVDTILSCGRTLLDTINHILDFCKINTFERDWEQARKPGSKPKRNESRSRSEMKGSNPLMNLYSIIDLAAVTEEVIEGVYVGQLYQDIGSSDIVDVSGLRYKRSEGRSNVGLGSLPGELVGERSAVKDIEVILDIAHEDFTFSAQSGAIRRIIMNVFGNAVKYTTKGTILVKLRLQDIDETPGADPASRMLEIGIEDTGKGISAEYLRTRLYTPFCQEDVLASGTGLGLSIVRSIVTILGGSIGIRSQVGQGTEVKICLPLMRASRTGSFSSSDNGTGSDDLVNSLKAEFSSKSIVLYGLTHGTESSRMLYQYIPNWFGIEILSNWSTSTPVDIIMVDEKLFPTLLEKKIVATSIIVLCSNRSRFNQKRSYADGSIVVEFMSKPFGPYKLAKTLRLCLGKANKIDSTIEPALPLHGESPLIPGVWAGDGVVSASEPVNERTATDALSSNSQPEKSVIKDEGLSFPNRETAGQSCDIELPFRGPYPLFVPFAEPPLLDPPGTKRTSSQATISNHQKRPPRLLLVDDNLINLRLLETYVRKRNHTLVDSAQNGLLAVKAAQGNPGGYDIIFMDISMPVMNGFEATRAIREIEGENSRVHHGGGGHDEDRPQSSGGSALIVALTGLASDRDQSEAFTSGVDMFLTKPVSFKEVGRLLDNWEANGGRNNEMQHIDDNT